MKTPEETLRKGIFDLVMDHSNKSDKTLRSLKLDLDKYHIITGFTIQYKLKKLK
jgi:hypothetical protein